MSMEAAKSHLKIFDVPLEPYEEKYTKERLDQHVLPNVAIEEFG